MTKKIAVLGGDVIGLNLRLVDDIRAYEERRRQEVPWLF